MVIVILVLFDQFLRQVLLKSFALDSDFTEYQPFSMCLGHKLIIIIEEF